MAEAEKLYRAVLESDPGNEAALIHLAIIHRERKDFSTAIDLLNRAGKAHPRSYAVFHELGALNMRLVFVSAAIDAFTRATEINPSAVDAWVNLGDACKQQRRLDDAQNAYTQALRADPKSTWAHRQRGYLAFDQNEPALAVEHLTAAAATFGKEAPLFLTRGHAHTAIGQVEDALADYKEAIAIDPKLHVARMFIGLSLTTLGRLEDAEKAFLAALAAQPKDAPTAVHLGNLYRQQKKLVDATKLYEAAVKAQPSYTWAHAQLGFVLMERHDYQRAEKTLQRALELDPENDDVEISLGDLALRRHDDKEAEQRYRRILTRSPMHEQAAQKLATLALAQGHIDQARALCTRVVATSPKNMPAWVTLGDVERAAKNIQAALEAYGHALKLAPESSWARRQMGFALFEAKRDPEAVVQLERSLQDGPSSAGSVAPNLPAAANSEEDFEVLLTLGHIARRRGEPVVAKAWYEKAQTAAPKLGRAHLFAADIERELGHLEVAIEGLQTAVQLEPTLFDAWVLLGDASSLAGQRVMGQAASQPVSSSMPTSLPTGLSERFVELAENAYSKAIALAVASSDPASNLANLKAAWPKRQLGFLKFYADQHKLAGPLLHDARPGFTDDPEIPLVLGHIAREQGDTTKALALYEDSASLTDTDPRPAIFSAVVLRDTGRTADALERLKTVIEAHPDSAWAQYEVALSYLSMKQREPALIAVKRSLELDQRQREAWLLLGKLEHLKRRYDVAIRAYREALALSPEYAPAEVALASALFDQGASATLAEAGALVERALVDLPEDAFAHVVAGRVFAAIAVRTASGQTFSIDKGLRGFDVGLTAEQIAVRHLLISLQRMPNDDALRLSVSTTLVELDRLELAQVTLHPLVDKSATRCPPDEFSVTYRLLDDGIASNLAELNSAERQEMTSEDVASLAQLTAGTLADRAGNAQLARVHFACSMTIQPHRSEAHLRLGLSYENDGFLRFAEDHYATAATLDPKSIPAREGLDRLRKEGGIAVFDGLRLSGEVGYRSEAVPPEVLYRNTRALEERGGSTALALTVPRTFSAQATTSIKHSTWRYVPRFDLSYRFFREDGAFLNDRQRVEPRLGHNPELKIAGTVPVRARFGEWTYALTESVVFAESNSRKEARALTTLSSRLNWFRVLSVEAMLGYEIGGYLPREIDVQAPLGNLASHLLIGGVRAEPWLAAFNLRLVVDYRFEAVWLVPSSQKIWTHVLQTQIGTRLRSVEFDQFVRIAFSGFTFTPGQSPSTFAYTLRTRGAYFFQSVFSAGANVTFGSAVAERKTDTISLGVDVMYNWRWPKIAGVSHNGFRFYAAYDARFAYNQGKTDHLITAGVSFAR